MAQFTYESLSPAIEARILADRAAGWRNPYAYKDEEPPRRDGERDRSTLLRPAFLRDAEKILHSPFYNRYADKTQVFSFYRNDDLSRRGLHVQLVSRIARNLGRALGLNEDLIEAAALGHDIGHTPFGHAGEKFLDELYYSHAGKHFSHNLHSVRVLDRILPYNLSLPTLNAILCHNGESERPVYTPMPMENYAALDAACARCYADPEENLRLLPATLEGCAVRIADLIAYLGKDRQDAVRAHLIGAEEGAFAPGTIGTHNAEIIGNLTVNVIENSYGKPYLSLDDAHFSALAAAKKDNYEKIYLNESVSAKTAATVKPLFALLYEKIRRDLTEKNEESFVFRHHIAQVEASPYHAFRATPYREEDPDDVTVDYIASMTDDYFVDLCARLFPDMPRIPYIGYFD